MLFKETKFIVHPDYTRWESLWYDFRVIVQPLLLGFFPPYSIILTLSAAAGLGISVWLAEDRKTFLVDIGLGILSISLLGARLGYVVRNLSFFLNNPIQIPQFWLGGLSWAGGLLAAAAALWGVNLIWKEPLGELADIFLPLLGTTVVAIWLTAWGAGIDFGPPTDAWFGIPVRDLFGVHDYRWPLPIIGGLISGGWIVGTILYPLKKFREPGFRAGLGLAGLVFINGVFSLFRIDPAPTLWGLRWETWISLVILGLIIGFYFQGRKTTGKKQT